MQRSVERTSDLSARGSPTCVPTCHEGNDHPGAGSNPNEVEFIGRCGDFVITPGAARVLLRIMRKAAARKEIRGSDEADGLISELS